LIFAIAINAKTMITTTMTRINNILTRRGLLLQELIECGGRVDDDQPRLFGPRFSGLIAVALPHPESLD
jgi:hypothetical protein